MKEKLIKLILAIITGALGFGMMIYPMVSIRIIMTTVGLITLAAAFANIFSLFKKKKK